MHTLKIQLTTRELANAFVATYGETAVDEWQEVKKFAEGLTIDGIMETVLDTIEDYGVNKNREFVESDGTTSIADKVEEIFQKRFD